MPGHSFISLVHHRGSEPTFINAAAIMAVSACQPGKGGAMLKLPDGSLFRTDTNVDDVLAMIAGAGALA